MAQTADTVEKCWWLTFFFLSLSVAKPLCHNEVNKQQKFVWFILGIQYTPACHCSFLWSSRSTQSLEETIHVLDGENIWARHVKRLCTLCPFSCPWDSNANYHKKYVNPGLLCISYCIYHRIKSVCLPKLFW